MSTARDLVILSLKEAGVLGVGQTPLAEDINDGFTLLKRMLSQWQKKRWLIPMLIDVKADGNNLVSNPIGDGQYWDTPRPDKLQSAYFVQKNNDQNTVSYPLELIWSYEDYSQIALKHLNSFPYGVFYDGAFPNGNIFVYPIPSDQYEIHLIVKGQLGFPNGLDQVLMLPPEYEEAIHYNLCIRLCSMYQYPVNQVQAGLAKLALNTIKVANAQIPTLSMPAGLGGRYGGGLIGLFGGGSSKVEIPTPITITTANAILDYNQHIYYVDFAGDVSLQLPLAATAALQTIPNLIIKDISGQASVNNITLIPNIEDVNGIDGQNPYVINTDFGGVNLNPARLGWAVIP